MRWTSPLIRFDFFIIFFFLKEDVGDFCEPLRLAEGLQVRLKSAFIFTAYKLLDFDFANV